MVKLGNNADLKLFYSDCQVDEQNKVCSSLKPSFHKNANNNMLVTRYKGWSKQEQSRWPCLPPSNGMPQMTLFSPSNGMSQITLFTPSNGTLQMTLFTPSNGMRQITLFTPSNDTHQMTLFTSSNDMPQMTFFISSNGMSRMTC